MNNNRIDAGHFNTEIRNEIAQTRNSIELLSGEHHTTVRTLRAQTAELERLETELLTYQQVLGLTGNYDDHETIDRYTIAKELLSAAMLAGNDAARTGAEAAALTVQRIIREAPSAAPAPDAARELLKGIDYPLLREQKMVLLAVIDHFRKGGAIHDGPETRTAVAEAMEGLLHLVDAVQDTADTVGLMPADGWATDDDPAPTCGRCGKQVPEGGGWPDGDDRLCEQCAGARGILTCDYCGDTAPEAELKFIGDSSERICQRCAAAVAPRG